MKTQILVFFFVFSCSTLFSQQKSDSIQKTKTDFPITLSSNTLGVDASALIFYGGASFGTSLNYECLISRKKSPYSYYLRTGVGYFGFGAGDQGILGLQIPVSIVYLSGKRNSHFEADLGCRVVSDFKSVFPYPIVNLGYRYQQPNEGLFFKALAGTDGLTLGVGYAF